MVQGDFSFPPALAPAEEVTTFPEATVDLSNRDKAAEPHSLYAGERLVHQNATWSGLPSVPGSVPWRGSNSLNASQAFMALSSAVFLSTY